LGFSKGFATGWYPRPGQTEDKQLQHHAYSMCCSLAMLQSTHDQACNHNINKPFLDVLSYINQTNVLDHYISIQNKEPSYKHVML
jgi:hypothetical protein